MNKFHFLPLLLLPLLTCRLDAQWVSLGQTGFNVTSAPYISVAVDTDNVPYIAFEDPDSANSGLTVMKYTGSAWVPVGGHRGISQSGINYTSIAIGPNNQPYVAFQDNGVGGTGTLKTNVMTYNGTSWVYLGNMDFSAGEAFQMSLAFDHAGNLYIAYNDASTSAVTIQKYNGSSWAAVGIEPTIPLYVNNSAVSLAFDASNTPYVAFSDGSSSGKISVLQFNGTLWSYLGLTGGLTATNSDWASLAFDGSTPYVAYVDGGDSMKVSVMSYNGTSWSNVGNPGFSPGIDDGYVSLALDPQGTPYVSYSDFNGNLSVSKYTGGSWALVGGAGFNPDPASYGNEAIDKNGDVFVSYDPSLTPTDAPVVKHEGALGIANPAATSDMVIYPNPAQNTLMMRCGQSGTLSVDIVNLLGEKVREYEMTGTQAQFDISGLAPGIYQVSAIDTQHTLHISKFVKE